MNNENLELASLTKRIFAFLIDELIITILVYVIFWDSLVTNSANVDQLANVLASLIFPVFFVKFIYQSFFVWYYGATIGKLVLKIRVIDYYNFGRVSLSSSIIRSISRIASEYFVYIGFIFAFFTEGRQAFHDKTGRTLVVNA
ncbi:RDD family protein [Campylobacterota bacterium DY0563]